MRLVSATLTAVLVLASCGNGNGGEGDAGQAGGGGPEDRLDVIQERGTLLVGMGIYPPESYFDPEGNWLGYDAEIFKLICADLGVECVPVVIPLASVGPALNNGTIDSFIGLYKTPEREEFAAFTHEVEAASEVLAVGADSGIDGIEDIEGKRLGSVRGSFELEALQGLTEDYPSDISVYESGDVMLQDLIAGRIDAVVWPADLINYAIDTDPAFKDIQIATEIPVEYIPGGSEGLKLYFVAPVGEEGQRLLEAMNESIDGLVESGQIAEILEPYGLTPPSPSA
jgi:ABC-type amino acid transport substrate-binding protein